MNFLTTTNEPQHPKETIMCNTVKKTTATNPERLFLVSSLALSALLTGCGMGTASVNATHAATLSGAAFHGKVYGGQQPIVGATIQLYAAGAAGYGSASTPLITASVVTDATGAFSISGDYTCPSPSSQVYLAATGGNSGFTTNSKIAELAALGSCSNLSSSTFVNLNEVTTVGTVWALAPFMTGVANVGTSANNTTGLANAFADVNTLVNIATGFAPGTAVPAGATVPAAEVHTIANILASCINSDGSTTSGSACGMLFTAATEGGTTPTDTVMAGLNIAKYPGNNVSTLFNLAVSAPPFQPTLSSAPNDFTIAVNFTGGNFSAPSALAADASGNVWITNATGNTVTELTHAGTVLSGPGYTGSLSTPSAIAIAADGTAWIANAGNNTVSRLTSTGGVYAGSPYTGSFSAPSSIAFDSTGNAWVTNPTGGYLTTINSTGSTLTKYTPSGATTPLAVAVTPR